MKNLNKEQTSLFSLRELRNYFLIVDEVQISLKSLILRHFIRLKIRWILILNSAK